MLGYQSIDGVPITVNDWLLNDVLRGEWGYTGTLVTDWDNVGRMVWEQQVLRRLRRRRRRRRPGRQRHGHDDARASSRAPRRRSREGLLDEADIDAAVAPHAAR